MAPSVFGANYSPKLAIMHICPLSNIHKRWAVVNTPAAFFLKNISRGHVSDPAGILCPALAFPHLVPRIQQQPYLSGFLSLLYHFMNSVMSSM